MRENKRFGAAAGLRRGAALALAVCLAAGLGACQQNKTTDAGAEGSADGKGIAVCVGPAPNTMDPSYNVAMDVSTILTHLFEGLYTVSDTGEPRPAQAESCEISGDGLSYTFTLREGLLWSDGTPVTAEDYVYSWRRMADPDSGNPGSYMLQCVDGYEEAMESDEMEKLRIFAPDSRTLSVKLKAPCSYFISMISAPYFLPVQEKTVAQYGDEWAVSGEHYVSNGPYVMKEWVHDSYVRMEKNPKYWNAGEVLPEEIKFLFFTSHSSELAAFEAGELQFADDVPLEEMERLRGAGVLKTTPLMGNYYISFQTEKAPFDSPLVRKALTLALDRDWLCKNIGKSGEEPAGAFVPPVIRDQAGGKFRDRGSYFDPSGSANESNLEEARRALAQAGFPEGEGLPVIELLYVEGSVYEAMAEAVQNQWAQLGVRCSLVKQEWGTFISTVQNKDYQAASLSWMGDYDDPGAFLSLYVTDHANNYSGWSDPDYDGLIEETARNAMSEEERMEKFHDAEAILFDQWVLCPIYYFVDAYLQAPELKGVSSSVYGTKSFVGAGIQ